MATVILGENITVTLMDPGTNSNGKRTLQDRTFYEFRNKGFVLLHVRTQDPHSKVDTVMAAPVVMEKFEDLKVYHRPNYIYSLASRKSYNIKTFAMYLSICAHTSEPFSNVGELLNFREFEVVVPSAERALISSFQKNGSRWGEAGYPRVRVDCLASSPTASGIFTTTPDDVTDVVLKEFHNHAHFIHHFVSKTEDQRQAEKWGPFFKKPVHLYLGVPSLPSAALATLAYQAGVRLMLRQGPHYVMYHR